GGAGAGVHGPAARYAHAGHPDRRGVPGLVHQRPVGGSAGGGRCVAGAADRRRRTDAGRPRVAGRARGRRAGRARPGLHRGGRPVALRRLLDVPGDEPRRARAPTARRLHLQPQLRGAARPGRPYPPGVAAAGRRDRGRATARRTLRPELRGQMEPFTTHTGTVAPLRRSNVDTDQIIPAVYLKRISRTGFADGLFRAWRDDPDFVLNQEAYREASILVAGPEFGVGSSREHAVWALRDWGFRVVVAPSFGDIFRGNALKEGLLVVELPMPVVQQLWETAERDPATEVTVDLHSRTVRTAGQVWPFPLDDFSRWRLLEGLDDIGLTLRHEADIAAFEQRRSTLLPSVR